MGLFDKIKDGNAQKAPKAAKASKGSELAAMPQAGYTARDPKDEFAEIYGSAMLNSSRAFVLAGLLAVLAGGAVVGLYGVATSKVAIPWLVEYNSSGEMISKPVKLQIVTPPQAVVKAELAKWLEQVYTIDSKQTVRLFGEANRRASGKAIEQFRDFRVEQDIMRRLREQPDFIRVATVNSVDISQGEGLAFAYVSTKESAGTEAPGNPKTFRVTLQYQIRPPKTEAEIFANPLGLYVTFFNPIAERR